MEECSEHYTKYLSNLDFLKLSGLETNWKDWYVTGAFYCSVHLVEGYLHCFKAKGTINHKERLILVRADSILQRVFTSYSLLYHESLKARYYDKNFSEDDIELIKASLVDVEKRLCPLIPARQRSKAAR